MFPCRTHPCVTLSHDIHSGTDCDFYLPLTPFFSPLSHLLRWILHTMGDPEEDDEVIDLLADSDYEEDSMME